MKMMKQVFKVTIILCLAIAMIGANVSNAYAAESINSAEISVSDDFIYTLDKSFENIDNLLVIDKYEEDVTNYFLEEYIDEYKNGEYSKIYQYVSNNVSLISIDEGMVETNTRSPFVTQYASEFFYKPLNQNGAAGEVSYWLRGSFQWDRATGKIVSKSGTTIDINAITFGDAWDTEISNMSTSSSISSDGYSVTFAGSFKLRAVYYQFYIIPMIDETFNISSYFVEVPDSTL